MKAASYEVELLQRLILDSAANTLSSTVFVSKDVSNAKKRLKHEGPSFATITLPSFLDSFMSAIEEGMVTSSHFVGWKKRQSLPVFLQGFSKLVFDTEGRLRPDADIQAIRSVRQICNFQKKPKTACSEDRIKSAYQNYKKTDNDLPTDCYAVTGSSTYSQFRTLSRLVVSSIFPCDVAVEKLLPHHGPGSTAEKVTGNKKFIPQSSWPARLVKYFDADCMYSSEEVFNTVNPEIEYLDEANEVPVRVITVPKTHTKPRIIAMEPVAMQYTQQAVKDFVVNRLENADISRGHINFRDQSVNQRLALQSSKTRLLATLDLSEASDRVFNDFVITMLEVNPTLCDLVQRTRSKRAMLPTGELLELNKFASMGSALCFPIESLYFYILTIQAGIIHRGLDVSMQSVKRIARDIYVYGDDIICPVEQVETTITLFALFGNKVGLSKSFYKGPFRESCGVDAFNGYEVTPVYLRNPIPSSRRESTAIVSLVSTCNQLFDAGYTQTALWIKEAVERVLGKELPNVGKECSGLGWFGFSTLKASKKLKRRNRRYQRIEVLTLVPKVRRKPDLLDGYPALAKCLLKLERQQQGPPGPYDVVESSPEHLVSTPRRSSLTLKSCWVDPR